ncbi:hypothetical protein PCASD_25892 [Puccinia coronata f. sp. avenae]|uniref:Uncharacterized protein n=1 Tax=Puccinia coronata f. sp. avenae TaxID=200324 RepID=A0A2N5THC9_9BASI|nr:hypothetical protein PCASD_25892 [Puccinia coronata f. sp. avenae]
MTSRAPSPSDSEMGGGSPPSPPPIHAPLPYRPGALDLPTTLRLPPPSRPTSTAPSVAASLDEATPRQPKAEQRMAQQQESQHAGP